MASATVTYTTPELALMEELDDLAGGIMRRDQYRALLASCTSVGLNTLTMQTVGSGYWHVPYFDEEAPRWTGWTFSSGADNHHYLLNEGGQMRAYTALRASSTSTAVDLNTNTLTDGAANFTTATAVTADDIVIFTASGATAVVVTRDSATALTLAPLTWGREMVVGDAYLIGRAPGTDTTTTYTATGYRVDWDLAIRKVLLRLRLLKSRQPGLTLGDLGVTIDDVYNRLSREYRQRVGVTSA